MYHSYLKPVGNGSGGGSAVLVRGLLHVLGAVVKHESAIIVWNYSGTRTPCGDATDRALQGHPAEGGGQRRRLLGRVGGGCICGLIGMFEEKLSTCYYYGHSAIYVSQGARHMIDI